MDGRSFIGLSIAVGMGLGVALGLVLNNLALGIGLGLAIGAAAGLGLDHVSKGATSDPVSQDAEPAPRDQSDPDLARREDSAGD